MSTITEAQEKKIADFLVGQTLSRGTETETSVCSIVAINLAVTGTHTDVTPDYMSNVIGEFIVRMQDEMPGRMRNTKKWKAFLPLAAGTGRDKEKEKKRLTLIVAFVWELLKQYQPIAD